MKTFLLITASLLLFSCRTVQKIADDRHTVAHSETITTGNNLEKQWIDDTKVKSSGLSANSSSDNGFERLIEEQVMEYNIPRKDSITAGKIVQTRRTIKERGKYQQTSVQQLWVQDSLRKQETLQLKQDNQSAILTDVSVVQQRRLTKRTGIPWYVWVGGGVTISLGIWLKKRFQLHRGSMQNRQIHQG